MRQYDGLVFNAHRAAILPSLHVHLPLVETKLTDVRTQQKNVRTLHQGIQDLGRGQVAFVAAHNGAAPLHTHEGSHAADVQHLGPVLSSILVDKVGGPNKADVLHFHAAGLPNMHEVHACVLDLFHIPAHLVVHERKPVCHIEFEDSSCLCALVHIDSLEETLRNVHAAGRLEAIIENKLLLARDQLLQFWLCLAFLTHAAQELELLI
mmetsp:Transcript_130122/g.308715  ORF Transcript_130122/g.308715 Transcript_130122/m.308715 type:complete len:208 (+) Transcript_130122:1566-2189(+)